LSTDNGLVFTPPLGHYATRLGASWSWDLGGIDEQVQCAQFATDWYLEGRRDVPPFPERPQFEDAVANLFAQAGRTATDDEVTVIVNVFVGLERDALLAPSPTGRMIIAGKLFDA
jgi:hypothetical protein